MCKGLIPIDKRVIRVKGQATVREKPDWIVISFEIAVNNFDYKTCAMELAKFTELLRNDLESVGVEKDSLKTGRLSVSAEFDSRENRRVFTGYIASHDLKLEFPFNTERLNLVLSQLSRTRSHTNFNLQFTVKEPELLRNKAMAEAVRAAGRRASLLAEAAGVTLGKLLQIDYSWSDIYVYSSSIALSEAAPMYDITPNEVKLEESVNVVWEIDGG